MALIAFFVVGYLTDESPDKKFNFKMKLWKWIALLIGLNLLGFGLILFDMNWYEINAVTFSNVGLPYIIGVIIISGPGIMVFYVGMTLMSLIVSENTRGIIFSINGIVGAILVLASMGIAAMTLPTNKILIYYFGFGVLLFMLLSIMALGVMGKLKL